MLVIQKSPPSSAESEIQDGANDGSIETALIKIIAKYERDLLLKTTMDPTAIDSQDEASLGL